MDIIFLGTGSGFPTALRGVSATAVRFEGGDIWLFDCGEGTQVQLQRSSLKLSKINKIFITHLHGDHDSRPMLSDEVSELVGPHHYILAQELLFDKKVDDLLFGLPGMMCTLGAQVSDKKKDFVMEIYGPLGLRRYIRETLCLSRSPLEFRYVVHEMQLDSDQYKQMRACWRINEYAVGPLHPQEVQGRQIHSTRGNKPVWSLISNQSVNVVAGLLVHRIPSFGFVLEEQAITGRLDAELLVARGVPVGPLYARIKGGETITAPDGTVIKPEDVIGPPKPGRKITILGDTSNSSNMIQIASGSDLLIHEATRDEANRAAAIEHGHSTPVMAAEFAASISAKSLILYHFSQRYKHDKAGSSMPPDDCVSSLLAEARDTLKALHHSCHVKVAYDLMQHSVLRAPPSET